MEVVKSEGMIQLRCDKLPGAAFPRTRLQVWFIWVCSSVLLWTCLVQLVAVGELWHPKFLKRLSNRFSHPLSLVTEDPFLLPPPLTTASESCVSSASLLNVCGLLV